MTKFKVGAAKTSGGYDAFIFEITCQRIFGKINDEGWCGTTWRLDGGAHRVEGYNLLPNAEPLREEFEADLITVGLAHPKEKWVTGLILPENTRLYCGVRVRVTVEAME